MNIAVLELFEKRVLGIFPLRQRMEGIFFLSWKSENKWKMDKEAKGRKAWPYVELPLNFDVSLIKKKSFQVFVSKTSNFFEVPRFGGFIGGQKSKK